MYTCIQACIHQEYTGANICVSIQRNLKTTKIAISSLTVWHFWEVLLFTDNQACKTLGDAYHSIISIIKEFMPGPDETQSVNMSKQEYFIELHFSKLIITNITDQIIGINLLSFTDHMLL